MPSVSAKKKREKYFYIKIKIYGIFFLVRKKMNFMELNPTEL